MKKLVALFAFLYSIAGMAKINPGEIIILGFESSTGGGAVNEVWFVALAPIDSGETVYLTDNTITSTAPFTLGGGTGDTWLSFKVNQDLNVGATWIIGGLTTLTPSLTTARSSVGTAAITSITSGGAFDLSFGNNGDDLILYQGTSTVARNFIYGVGADPAGGGSQSQFDPALAANVTKMSNWGLTPGLTANFFDNGNSNYKLLGANPALINFNGDIDAILVSLGDPASYIFDSKYVLNSTSSVGDLTLGTISPQPSGRYYNPVDGLWYTDQAFTTLAIDPNRTHTVVVLSGSYNIALNDTLDVAGIVVGDSVNSTTVTAEAGSYLQTVYGVTVTNNGTFVLENQAVTNIGSDFDVMTGGTAILEPNAHLDFNGNLNVEGTMTLNADATGFSSLGLHGLSIQEITGSGTINAELYFANSGWHHLSAPGSIAFSNVSFDNGMNLYFTGAQTNVYRWDPAPSSTDPGWYPTTSTSDFGDSAFAVYFFPANVPCTINLAYVADNMDADINVSTGNHEHVARYKVPTGNPVNSTDGWLSSDNTPGNNGGWNMMKNPYWGHISWQRIDDGLPANVGSAVYFWNPSTGSYDTWVDGAGSTSYDIIPLLAYFAKAEAPAAGAQINRGQAHIFDGTENWFGKASNVKAQLILNASSEGRTSTAALLFDEAATDAFDLKFDAYYRGVNPDQVTFNIVSSDSIGLKIDQRPFPSGTSQMYMSYAYHKDGATGRISIDPSFLPMGVYAYLEDIHENIIVDLNAGDYVFTNDLNAPVQRFILHMTNTSVSIQELSAEEETLTAFRSNEQIVLNADILDGPYTVEVIDMTGRTLHSEEIAFETGRGDLNFNGNGPLLIRLWAGSEVHTIKMF